ncbi:rhomboid-related protein 2-like [Euwallacea similis]|uniref:rhomboid-related protein 2-like n=1 Tax=Euwallacea similis TaxID=1736056 RepID=UPI00344D667A
MTHNSHSVEIPLKSTRKFNRTDDYFRSIFNKFDRDGDGFITVTELNDMIESREYEQDIPAHCVQKIHELHDTNLDRKLNFEEFIEMIHNPELSQIFGHYFTRYINLIIPRKAPHPSHTATDGIYEEEYSCYPPAVGMIIISLIEIILFCVDEFTEKDSTKIASGPTATLFIYEPYKRHEAWRYLTYMFVHIGIFHLFVNLAVQIMLGVPLEMVHKWWRVLIVYFAGVLAGSLATSVTDPYVKLAGASGGVYSLITAHVASIIMNWKEMSFPLVQLLIFVLVGGVDIGTAIYHRYVLDKVQSIGYVAHFGGAVAGLLVGINILRNLSVTKPERLIWWISIMLFSSLMAVCIIWNLAWPDYFPKDPYEDHRYWVENYFNSNKTNKKSS